MTTPSQPVRVRYAPSPTGFLHVGGARTALFNYLFARHHGGAFILRVEDTDRARYDPEAEADLLHGLRFLGLEWDEGPEVGGEFGPYRQTARLDLYRTYIRQLIEGGVAYPCFCSRERLGRVRQEQQRAGLNPGYDRHCRRLDPAEAARRVEAGESHVVRLKVPLDGDIVARDYIRGEISFQNKLLQDIVILKTDGIPTYHLANVVDDHLMEISHILRGDEWVSSIPYHLHLYQALGWEPPVMAHLPLILKPTGKGKISKRPERLPDGRLMPVFVRDYEELGFLPEALINFMALVGWSYDDKTEIMSKAELIERFSLDRVRAAPAAWNFEKLESFNGVYIRGLDPEDLTGRLLPFLARAGLQADRETLRKIAPSIQERLKTLADVVDLVDFFFLEELPPYDPAALIPKKLAAADALQALGQARATLAGTPFEPGALESALRDLAKSLGFKAGQLFLPIRVAVCGKTVAPPLFDTLAVLGPEKVLQRLDKAIEMLKDLPVDA
ncbi:MAG: glutamate--tRNA ligase [Anaerolineae bacterium]